MQNDFIEFVRHETGLEKADIDKFVFGECYDLIERFTHSKQCDLCNTEKL